MPATVVLASFAATGLSVLLLRRYGVVDVPNHRSTHTAPVVRGAGIGMFVALLIPPALGGVGWSVVLVATLYGLLGLWDDLISLPAIARLIMQLVVASLALVVVPVNITDASILAGVIVMAYYVNAVNFMDGINGITGMHGVVAGMGAFILWPGQDVKTLALLLVASCVGFLPWNFPKARAFPGDSGAYYVGGFIGCLGLLAFNSGAALLELLAPAAIYITDTVLTIVSRFLRRESIFEGHRDHVYQRLVDGGMSSRGTLLIVTSWHLMAISVPLLVGTAYLAWVTILLVAVSYRMTPHFQMRIHVVNSRGEPS